MDLLVHYEHFLRLIGKSLFEAWTDPKTTALGKEPYPVLFKYLLGHISTSPNLFSACACAIYTALFVFGIVKPLRPLFIQRMSLPAWLLFLGVIFVIEYYWFLGFRFWSGAFVFTGFYLRYINTGKIKYLWLSSLCTCFHYSLFVLCVIAILNLILRCKIKFYYLIFAVSIVVRFLKIGLIWTIAQFGIFDNYVKDTVRNQSVIQSVRQVAENVRESGNWFYLYREAVIFLGVLAVIYILYKKVGKDFIEQNTNLWGFCILLFSLANFGYVSLTFYDRFFKIALLFLCVFAYMWVMSVQYKLDRRSQLQLALIAFLPIAYSVITPMIEQRQTLFALKLWFSNFLTHFVCCS